MNEPETPFSTVFQQLLDINEDLVEAIAEKQNANQLEQSVRYHELLHRNLMELGDYVDRMMSNIDQVRTY